MPTREEKQLIAEAEGTMPFRRHRFATRPDGTLSPLRGNPARKGDTAETKPWLFRKGQRGNPRGQRKLDENGNPIAPKRPDPRTRRKYHADQAEMEIYRIMRDSEKPELRLKAAVYLHEREYGKSSQHVQIDGSVDHNVNHNLTSWLVEAQTILSTATPEQIRKARIVDVSVIPDRHDERVLANIARTGPDHRGEPPSPLLLELLNKQS